jgi:transposase
MRAYPEDLRGKIVEAVQRGMVQSEAARSFGVSFSSVKRYLRASTWMSCRRWPSAS